MHRHHNFFISGVLAAAILCLVMVPPVAARQTQCGYADAIEFPVDTGTFQMTQDFGTPSSRYQGRYHTGEDWYGGEGSSFGAFVRAAATGRVTFASPNGWGVDGGVIIIEHTFRDDTIVYSMYGHITNTTGVSFPAPFSCVTIGDIIAAIGDARPAPHLHFEMRVNQPDIPGAGYTWDDPVELGFRRPTKFILNARARTTDGFAFVADIADETGSIAPPIVTSGEGLLTLDANRVLNLSNDGRVLWRTVLERRAIALVPDPQGGEGALIVYDDGGIQPISSEGTLGAAITQSTRLTGAPTRFGDRWVFATADGGLTAWDAALTAAAWQLADVGDPVRIAASGRLLGVILSDGRVLTIDRSGALLDTAMLREPAALTTAANGDLLLFSRGGLWQIDEGGRWSLRREEALPGGVRSALVESADGAALYAFDGEVLRAYTPDLRWQVALPGVTGVITLTLHDAIVLLTSSGGDVIALQREAGGVCNRIRLYGDSRSQLWHALGDDGMLRVHVADQIVGFRWSDFLMACG